MHAPENWGGDGARYREGTACPAALRGTVDLIVSNPPYVSIGEWPDLPDDVRRDLARRGHPVDTVGDLDGPCSVEIIRRDENGMLYAGSDPRRDGWALAW